MKQILVTLIFVLVSSMSNAQYVPDFKMNYDGNFTTQKGESYDVAVMEGKSATELFDKVKKNVALVFRSPKEVESNVDDKIISIYGYAPNAHIWLFLDGSTTSRFIIRSSSSSKMGKLE